jgi:hypothetical protein
MPIKLTKEDDIACAHKHHSVVIYITFGEHFTSRNLNSIEDSALYLQMMSKRKKELKQDYEKMVRRITKPSHLGNELDKLQTACEKLLSLLNDRKSGEKEE